jgi:hypothetical protein
MSEYFAIQFPFAGVAAWLEVSAILRAGHCPMPSAYRDDEHLLLVWRYERHANECAWELCHHVMHILLYEKMPDMHRFYNEFRTEPIMCSSERLCRVLRFGLPHGFMCDGELPPLEMDELVPLYECEMDETAFEGSVRALLERTLLVCSRAEISTWDTSLLYLTYKRLEAMAITCNRHDSEVEIAMENINEAIRKAQ